MDQGHNKSVLTVFEMLEGETGEDAGLNFSSELVFCRSSPPSVSHTADTRNRILWHGQGGV